MVSVKKQYLSPVANFHAVQCRTAVLGISDANAFHYGGAGTYDSYTTNDNGDY
jgi:hypothetical protein